MRDVAVRQCLVMVVCLAAVLASCGTGRGVDGKVGETDETMSAAYGQFDFGGYFEYTPLESPSPGEHYTLPLSDGDVVGLAEISDRLGLESQTRDFLLQHGFTVADFGLIPRCDDVVTAYEALSRSHIPILVTSGSLLHTYHILFDDLLSSLEARYLYDDMWQLSQALLARCLAMEAEGDGDLAEAARRDAAFLAVALELMEPKEDQIPQHKESRMIRDENPKEFQPGDLEKYAFDVPPEIADLAAQEVDLVLGHAGMTPSPMFIYNEDYSQYVPRGHYTASEKLRNYFRAMMWFGRMSMLLKGSEEIEPGETCLSCDAFISEYDARIQTLGAMLLADLMKQQAELMQIWERTYRVTAFFVGYSDDLGPYEYIDAMNQVFGSRPDFGSYSPADHGKLKAKLAEFGAPKIYGGTGNCTIPPPFTPEQADECLVKTRGFRLMGQRFVPDSYILSKMVTPYTGEFLGDELPFTAFVVPGVGIQRVFPRGLDVMAVLGSARARTVMDGLGDTDYETYGQAFSDIKAEIDAIGDDDWHQNLYWNWLWSLKVLLSDPGPGYPAFMRTDAWRDRALKIALASWAELRHDTILYVKQSYTMALSALPPRTIGFGYVEPCPELYNRLLAMTRMTRLGLASMDLLEAEQERRLQNLEQVLGTLVEISFTELEGQPLSQEENHYIGEFGDVLGSVVGDLEDRSRKTTIVADVHTDTNSGLVLEEGVGYVDLIVAAYDSGDEIYLAAGPELSYYEFKQPMDKRLTDEAWRAMLQTDPPPRPAWLP